jgi:spore germination protein GerM
VTRRRLAALMAGLALAAAACDVPTNDEPVALSGPFSQLQTTTTTSTTVVPSAEAKEVIVYLLRTDGGVTALQTVPRSVPVDAGVEATLRTLFTQPPSPDVPAEAELSSAIPPTATLLSAQRSEAAGDRLVVDVRGLFGEQGPQGVELRNALAQIVWTATHPTTGFSEVVFRNEGQPADALVDDLETTSEPVSRSDYSRTIS